VVLRFAGDAAGAFLPSDAASAHHWKSTAGGNPLVPKTGPALHAVTGTRGSMVAPELRQRHYDGQAGQGLWLTPLEGDDSLQSGLDDIPPFTCQLRGLVAIQRGESEKGPMCSWIEGRKSLFVVEAITESM